MSGRLTVYANQFITAVIFTFLLVACQQQQISEKDRSSPNKIQHDYTQHKTY